MPEDQPVTRFEFASLVAGSEGNLLDAVSIVPRCTGEEDADGDGRPNHRDSDADNDGRRDTEEAGHGAGNGAGQVGGPVGVNGIPDAVETAPDSGDTNFALQGLEDDDIPDFLDPAR